MSRRTQRPELAFGSDSFLDVVCNIVGILIILIVVVGVRVQRQPAVEDPATLAATQKLADQELQLSLNQQRLEQMLMSQEELEQRLQNLQAEEEQASLQIQQVMEAQETARQMLAADGQRSDRLRRQKDDLEADRATISARIASLQRDVENTRRETLKAGQVLATVAAAEREVEDELQTTVLETRRLHEVLAETTRDIIPKDRLEHRLSPVTRPVEQGELHFRVSNGHISEIPLEKLLERLKEQVLSRRSAVMRFNQFDGTVGPVSGYTMTYTVEKEGPSTLEALQSGDGRTRVNVSRWKIDPDPSLEDESFEEAVRPGSRYRQAIETAMPDTVVTMWIYPDSFEGFAALREIAHALQLRVAARPLPAGTPIVGSPSGSRSTAQ